MDMAKKEREEFRVPELRGPISQHTVVLPFGNFLFISGMGPVDGDFNLVGGSDPAA
jgi:enamine deaminase RidA (YjgF/YER057c/UK114 family)